MLTVIIPVFNLKGDRLRNFNCISYHLESLNATIIVAEQRSDNMVKTKFDKIILESNNPIFEKAKLLNYAVSRIKTPYIWMLDADVYMEYPSILSQVKFQDVIKPFKSIIKLDEEETINFITKEYIKLKANTVKVHITEFGPLSFIVKRSIYLGVGGMDETYVGWGWEDLDFANRIQQHYEVTELNGLGVHLNHEPSSVNEEANRQYYIETYGSI